MSRSTVAQEPEQRQHPRVRPLPKRPVEVQIMGAAFLEVLRAEDISVGGIGVRVPHGFLASDLEHAVELIVSLPDHKPFKAAAVIRHRPGAADSGKFGVEFTRVGDPAALESYVSRMLTLGRSV